MDSSSFQDTLNTDPELTFDDLPMPFKMLDKLLWNIFEETWNLIEAKEKHESEEFNFQQSCLQKLDVNVVNDCTYSINSKIWLEVYRLPVDVWMKEILPIVQEFQNAKMSTSSMETSTTQEITVNLIERKLFYENQFQLSSPVLLGRIKYQVIPPSPACKSVTAALKQANDKANLLSYSNLGTHLFSDAIIETNQLAFIEHRNYPSCLTAIPKPQLDEKNSVSVQEFIESPESVKPEEGVIEEVRYFGSEITYISVIYSSRSVNANETSIDDKENLPKKLDLINSRNNYLVIGLQSRLVIIKELQSGRYLPLFYTELGSLVDAGLSISAKYINLLTACYLNGNRHSNKDDLMLHKKFTFDIYNLDENQLTWKKTHIVGKKNFHCQAITILTVDDNFNVVVCLVSSKDLLIYSLDHQQNCLHHQQPVKQHIESDQSNQVVDADLDQFCQSSIQISLPNPYVINLNTGTVSLFPEVNEQWIDNVEFYNQLCLTSCSAKSSIQEVENDSHVNHEGKKEEKLNRRQGTYQLWIRGS
ncbi:hypothetical protein Smp_153020 [Schistosoma mansoni]|uniref:hypothetical protein n=1 Tax=Schistosoma mansoni TaxID=6183 RepID=UPI0001A63671|nr:hypothetical protein Smp_153020 [Schistosoma mansoni]|eukprot:XP_018653589.1 hypothetical protein Smp_153020 [Schistosoma mansoni]